VTVSARPGERERALFAEIINSSYNEYAGVLSRSEL
jgi:hypothetical protein